MDLIQMFHWERVMIQHWIKNRDYFRKSQSLYLESLYDEYAQYAANPETMPFDEWFRQRA